MAVQKLEVLDFSFLDIQDVKELTEKLDYASPPLQDSAPADGEGDPRQRHIKNAAALRICNNALKDIAGLFAASATIVANPVSLRWLDSSFNGISVVPDDFANFKDVSVIYLHANSISSLKDLKPLSKFSALRKLTLHGNPIEDEENYRVLINLLCPSLRMLDFSVITRQDQQDTKFYESAFKKKLRGR